MHYRAEVDGLRALAILPVLFFHADFTFLAGGFLGVDVFFVISGYLITSILLNDLTKERFSIVRFYERRARRILPALLFVLIISSVAAYILLIPEAFKEYGQSVVSVGLFSSNIFFYLNSGYFETSAEQAMLLHTWSLAIEEQFYLFFPPLLYWLYKHKVNLTTAFCTVAIVSLLFSTWYVEYDRSANFYLLPSRCWELLVGALIALHYSRFNSFRVATKELLAWSGCVTLLACYLFFEETLAHPSWLTLLPIAATACLIAFSENTSLAKLLSKGPIVGIGLISYSLYLWHQPIIALFNQKVVSSPSTVQYCLALGLTFLSAYFSWKYIEAPFRAPNRMGTRTIFRFSAATLLGLVLLGSCIHYLQGIPNRFNVSNDYSASVSHSPMREKCHTKGAEYLAPSEACRYFYDDTTWATLGDSHVVELSYALAQYLRGKEQGVRHFSFSQCPPAYGFNIGLHGCSSWLNEAVNEIINDNRIQNVVIAFRYTAIIDRNFVDYYEKLPKEWFYPEQDINLSTEQVNDFYTQGLTKIVSELIEAEKTVFLLYPVPELPIPIGQAVYPLTITGDEPSLDLTNSVSTDFYQTENRNILSKLDELVLQERVYSINPLNVYCNNKHCPAVLNDNALYYDDDHLSLYGASLLIDYLSKIAEPKS